MKDKRILAGSRAFFDGLSGFVPKDTDYVDIVDNEGIDFLFYRRRQDEEGNDIFMYVRQSRKRFMRWAVKYLNPSGIGAFLLPAFCAEFDITIEDLKTLRPLRERLDPRHEYLGMIYDFYMENGSMTLTDEQHQAAFDEYKKERKQI